MKKCFHIGKRITIASSTKNSDNSSILVMNTAYDYEKIVAGLSCDVREEDYEKLRIELQKLKDFARLDNRALALYDINTRSFIMKEDHHLEILGYLTDHIDKAGPGYSWSFRIFWNASR